MSSSLQPAAAPNLAGGENRCQFWLPNKRRLCANPPLPSSRFCGNHNPSAGDLRTPCPIDPSHSVTKENLKSHIKKCPLRKQAQALESQPYYTKGVDCDVPDVSSEAKRRAINALTAEEFRGLVRKIKSIRSSISEALPDSHLMPDACDKWFKRQIDRRVPYQEKHVKQQASILGNMEAIGILRKPNDELMDPVREEQTRGSNNLFGDKAEPPAVVEFGAGRGYLTHMLVDCYGIRKVLLVERRSYKLKADRNLRQIQDTSLERLRIDNKSFLLTYGITKEDFNAITWFSSWAVDADHSSDLSHDADQEIHLNTSEKDESGLKSRGIEEAARKMEAVERAALGFMCKEIIDIGRMLWLRERGFHAWLVKYVPSTISPENHLLLATRQSHSA